MDNKAVGRFSLQALTWLRDRQLPAIPVAYSVAYEYKKQQLEMLVERIDYLESKYQLDEDAINLLFKEFILAEYIDVDRFNRSVTGIVDSTHSAINETHSHLKAFQTFLIEAKLKIHELDTDAAVDLVLKLMERSENVVTSLTTLEDQLSETMADVRVLQKKFTLLERQANHDQLTGLLNRSALQLKFKSLLEKEENYPLTMVVTDIDHFKNFNDQYGHSIGDKVIKLVANTLTTHLKGTDVVSRYGGEEYVVILPSTRDTDALKLMDNIRQKIAQLNFINKSTNKPISGITMSFGLSEFKVQDNFHSLFDRSDKALYRAKQNGRNQVKLEK
ncbi:GGDEF domain-containing protein [Pleionea sp. CnH1-48]|uniref:GGDEF domain-containing protein n=1 Tax=Pleionea sp. CnH1-48 TaxID=2954494 RepID=UPI0020971A6E|nr:GGDEF domain-containing protein [Pleionea sp. CnH1-48]MCO7226659.1 GGDEF domain-containing protein [Pleionea sp. CnH1-48]